MQALVMLGFVFVVCIALVTTCSLPRSDARECAMQTYRMVSQASYGMASSSYSTSCGWWGWDRCRRTRYMQVSFRVYQQQIAGTQTECCDGYRMSDSTCIPICNGSCVSPRYCREPNDCQCIDSRYSGPNCDTPVCSSCPSPRVCLAPETCQCLPGYTGANCSEDINECESSGSLVCEQVCTNSKGSYECSCRDDFTLGNDIRRCVGRVNASLATINSSALLVEWSHPEWDRENLTVAYNVTCSNDIFGVNSSALLNDTAHVQLSLNLNTEGGYECCIIVITSNGNGPPSCSASQDLLTTEPPGRVNTDSEESPGMATTESLTTESPGVQNERAIVESSAFKIGVGVAGACLLVLILMLVICCITCLCRTHHTKKKVIFDSVPMPRRNSEQHEFTNELYVDDDMVKASTIDQEDLQYNDVYLESKNENEYATVREAPYHYVKY